MTPQKIILNICFLLISVFGFSQHKEYYFFDSNWKPVTSNDYYSYYRVIEYGSDGIPYTPVKDYYRDGNLQSEVHLDKYNSYGIKYSGNAIDMGMYNGKIVQYRKNGSYTISYYKNGKYSHTSNRFYPNNNDNSKISAGEVLAGAAIIGGLIYALSGDDDDDSSSISNSTPQYNMSKNNVSIISWGTYGSLAYPHASATIRNKNNYDVIVSIKVKQGSWKNSSLHSEMSDMSGYDYSENYNEEFKIKANSVRKVALRGDGSGRPTDIGFRYVN